MYKWVCLTTSLAACDLRRITRSLRAAHKYKHTHGTLAPRSRPMFVLNGFTTNVFLYFFVNPTTQLLNYLFIFTLKLHKAEFCNLG